MSFEFQNLEDAGIVLIDGDRGKNYPKQSDFSEKGHCLFLSAKNVTKDGFKFDDLSFISSDKDSQLRAGKLQKQDIILTTRGTIGNVAFLGDEVPYKHIRINSGMIIVRANQDRWNNRFLYYLMTSRSFQDQILSLTSGSAVPQLPARDLKKFALPIVPLEVQDSAERIISSLSDKIRNNSSLTHLLEQIAQAIFKSWFVDFEPTKAKIAARETLMAENPAATPEQIASAEQQAAIRAIATAGDVIPTQQLQIAADLFPNQLVGSELGEIPEGWILSDLNSICVLNSKSWTKKSCPPRINYVDLANTKSGVIEETTPFEWNEAPSRARRILSNGDTIVGTVRPGNHSYAYIASKHHLTGSTGFAVLTPKNAVWSEFLYIAATCDSNIERLAQLADGGAYPAVKPTVVTEFQLALPPPILVSNFHEIVNPMFEKRALNFTENVSLKMLRDNLLPKLLAGQMSYSDA